MKPIEPQPTVVDSNPVYKHGQWTWTDPDGRRETRPLPDEQWAVPRLIVGEWCWVEPKA